MKKISVAFSLIFIWASSASAVIQINAHTPVVFASVEQGKDILGRQDDFIMRLSPFDRASRMKTDRAVSEIEFLRFVQRNVLPWSREEKSKIKAALQALTPRLSKFFLSFPETIYIVKTTGAEEGGAAYTRSRAIVIPANYLAASTEKLLKTICHELFHIMSRSSPELRERFYRVIGFEKCNEIAFPDILKPRKITNPDAPRNDHYIAVEFKGMPMLAVPVLFSRTEKYNAQIGGEFFQYLIHQLLIVEKDEPTESVNPAYQRNIPLLLSPNEVSGYFEKIGRNTKYIIHPEEILADNFALLILEQKNVASPDILERIIEVLQKNRSNP